MTQRYETGVSSGTRSDAPAGAGREADADVMRVDGRPGGLAGPVVMGVLNVTPDSFSDGGRYADISAAVDHGVRMAEAGADLVDVGGESTRPGAGRVDAETEVARVVPVVAELAKRGVRLSVDTTRASVAARALAAGASWINDVSGGLADPEMAAVVADAGCPWILMHWRGPSDVMGEMTSYDDVVKQVHDELCERIDDALAAGVDANQLVLDPGIGFAKNAEHDWRLLAHLDRLIGVGLPVLVGTSRKRFLGRILPDADGSPRPAAGRDGATLATSVLAFQAGAWGVRVHDVGPTADAVAVLGAVRAARNAGGADIDRAQVGGGNSDVLNADAAKADVPGSDVPGSDVLNSGVLNSGVLNSGGADSGGSDSGGADDSGADDGGVNFGCAISGDTDSDGDDSGALGRRTNRCADADGVDIADADSAEVGAGGG